MGLGGVLGDVLNCLLLPGRRAAVHGSSKSKCSAGAPPTACGPLLLH